jgi:signal transduction histidine kinase
MKDDLDGLPDREAERFATLGRMAGGVAHDLNNYFAVVDVSLARAQTRVGDGSMLTELLRARAALDCAARLNRNVLLHARGGAPLLEKIDLAALVKRVVDLFGRSIAAGVQLVVDLDQDLQPINGVAAEVEQLVINLVLNGAEAMPRGGDLRVAVRHGGAGVVTVEVVDNGAGLTTDLSSRSATSPSTKGRPGVGLGLGIVHAVAERHGAAVHAMSRPGLGTRLMVAFPVRAD